MTPDLLSRLRSLFIDRFTYESEGEAGDALAEATRWGWLPALSGVAAGAAQARAWHAGSGAESP